MRAGAAMAQGKITVHAQHAEAGREIARFKPAIDIAASPTSSILPSHFFSVFRAIIIDMINRKKFHVLLAATGTNWPTIRLEHFEFECLMLCFADRFPFFTIDEPRVLVEIPTFLTFSKAWNWYASTPDT